MTEPTDAEILDLWESFVGEPTEEIPLSNSDKLCFARAARARWGHPSGAGEVVYQASHKDGFWQDCSRERYEYLLKAPTISSLVDWTLRILHTTPQPTQAQAGAVPLTVDEVEQLIAQWSYELHGDRARYLVRMTEQHHGIKGGQHGSDT